MAKYLSAYISFFYQNHWKHKKKMEILDFKWFFAEKLVGDFLAMKIFWWKVMFRDSLLAALYYYNLEQ